MGRLSRGCLRCRQRRVRCDESRPACQRCIHRNEACEGYRDESSLIFRHETDKVIEYSRAVQMASPPSYKDSSHSLPRKRSRSANASSASRRSTCFSSSLAPEEASGITLRNPQPWLKELPAPFQLPLEEQAVGQFIDKYVLYPCNQTSSPGFLEHLPCMFKEVNVDGRYALRWAVQAAAYADAVSQNQESNALASKALQCYGMALKALGESLSIPGKEPDDYDLMTVVVLDIFEVSIWFKIRIQFMLYTDLFRHCILPTKSAKDRTSREWRNCFVCAAVIWFTTPAAGVSFDLRTTEL